MCRSSTSILHVKISFAHSKETIKANATRQTRHSSRQRQAATVVLWRSRWCRNLPISVTIRPYILLNPVAAVKVHISKPVKNRSRGAIDGLVCTSHTLEAQQKLLWWCGRSIRYCLLLGMRVPVKQSLLLDPRRKAIVSSR